MKTITTLFTTMIFLLLAACTGAKDASREAVVQKNTDYPAPPPAKGRDQMGPSDGGGGAGKNGKPLESYQVNLRQRTEFKNHIEPILVNLSKTFPKLAGDLSHIVDERTWYLIPGPLRKLPAETMGLTEFIDFDQLAFQNLNEIWLDSTPYQDSMKELDQAHLLLHEMIMGVRLLEFSDALDKCLAEAKRLDLSEDTRGDYRKVRKKCYMDYPRFNPLSPKLSLADEDYSSIRSLVGELMENKGDVDEDMMTAWLASHGFHTYK